MLEVLLMQYEQQFGVPFPLADYAGWAEIDVINIVYDCLMNNRTESKDRKVPNRFPEAPGLKK